MEDSLAQLAWLSFSIAFRVCMEGDVFETTSKALIATDGIYGRICG